jgi:GNAT superfamily N-acetyltransferase
MLKRLVNAAWRWYAALSRPSPGRNLRALGERGEALQALRVRDATPADIPALARLHVTTWNTTYAPMGATGPSVAVREQQWRDGFAAAAPGWFCLVVERPDGELVGFAQVNRSDNPGYDIELRRLHLLRDYQRLGLGKRLLAEITRRILADGATSMWLWGDARNPSAGAWIALGAHKTDDDPGNGNYGWHDLPALLARCAPPDHAASTTTAPPEET